MNKIADKNIKKGSIRFIHCGELSGYYVEYEDGSILGPYSEEEAESVAEGSGAVKQRQPSNMTTNERGA